MQVLMLNTDDIEGGAARAAYRLHRGMLDAKIHSKMLVQNKASDDSYVIGPETKSKKAIAQLRPHLDRLRLIRYSVNTKEIFSTATIPDRLVSQISK